MSGREKMQTHAKVAWVLCGILIVASCGAGGNDDGADHQSSDQDSNTLEDHYGTTVDPGTAQHGGDLIFGLSAEGDSLDPTTSTTLVNQHIFTAMCRGLYMYTSDGTPQPDLATDMPRISDDETEYLITLRDDALFSDGSPMTADDVVATLERNLNSPESQRAAEMGPVESIDAVGEYEVRIILSEPFAPLVASLSDRPGMVQNLDGDPTDFGSDPSCVAPFRFADRVANTSITLEKDPNYYDADEVYLDGIVYRIIPDANVLAANLQAGEIHTTDRLSPQDYEALSQDDNVELLTSVNAGYQGIHINLNEETTGNVDLATNPVIREALNMAIDRDSLALAASNGVWTGACGPIAPTSVYSTEESEACPPYDPEGARELLEGQDVDVPFTVDLTVPNQQDPQRYAQALQSHVEEAGFNINIITTEFTTALSDASTGNFDALLLGWGGRADPDGNMQMYWLSSGNPNYSSFENPEVDRLMTDATHTTDTDERAALYGEAISLIREDAPYVFTYRIRNLAGVSGAQGVTKDIVGIIDPAFAALTN